MQHRSPRKKPSRHPFRAALSRVVLAALLGTGVSSAACGGDDELNRIDDEWPAPGAPRNNQAGDLNNGPGAMNNDPGGGGEPEEPFVPEQEEFLVRAVAATDHHVFVPNSDPDSHTVALIDGRDFSVLPLRVGREPTEVRAAQIAEQGAVAYVLCEGSAVVAVVRADMLSGLDRGHVHLLPIPREINALAMAPDGRHVLAYIDPDRPLSADASVASLQTMALIRLGDTPAEDRVFELSVTRLISSIQFSADSRQAFVVGREGVNRIHLAEIEDDTFVAPIRLDLSGELFAPEDQEVEVSADGRFMVVRTSQFRGLAVFEFPRNGQPGRTHVIELGGIPTDIDLVERPDAVGVPEHTIVATLRGEERVVIIDVATLLEAEDPETAAAARTEIAVRGAQAGIARLTPDNNRLLLFSTLVPTPLLGLLDLDSFEVTTHLLRNQIRTVAISPDSKTVVIAHVRQPGQPQDSDPLELFQRSHGLTIFDLETGYSRPILLAGEPMDVVMTSTAEGRPIVYAMLTSDQPANQGVVRIDLASFRTDFVRLPRTPVQLGLVAGKVYVSQDTPTGRITFFDIETGAQRTVSGYELNAGID